MNKQVKNIVKSIDRKALRNNTQRVLLAMLTSDQEWVPRTQLRVNSATSRVRDLRKTEFGGFRVRCASALELKRRAGDSRQTFYRIDKAAVTVRQLNKAFEGVISAR